MNFYCCMNLAQRMFHKTWSILHTFFNNPYFYLFFRSLVSYVTYVSSFTAEYVFLLVPSFSDFKSKSKTYTASRYKYSGEILHTSLGLSDIAFLLGEKIQMRMNKTQIQTHNTYASYILRIWCFYCSTHNNLLFWFATLLIFKIVINYS